MSDESDESFPLPTFFTDELEAVLGAAASAPPGSNDGDLPLISGGTGLEDDNEDPPAEASADGQAPDAEAGEGVSASPDQNPEDGAPDVEAGEGVSASPDQNPEDGAQDVEAGETVPQEASPNHQSTEIKRKRKRKPEGPRPPLRRSGRIRRPPRWFRDEVFELSRRPKPKRRLRLRP
ncbi:hypothetical protein V8E54_011824 [Elaphomyces granulatus]